MTQTNVGTFECDHQTFVFAMGISSQIKLCIHIHIRMQWYALVNTPFN